MLGLRDDNGINIQYDSTKQYDNAQTGKYQYNCGERGKGGIS